MMIGKHTGPAHAQRSAPIDWREVARVTCLEVDWAKIAHSALGSAVLAGLVGGALQMIGKSIEAEMRAEAEAARRAEEARRAESARIVREVIEEVLAGESERTADAGDGANAEASAADTANATDQANTAGQRDTDTKQSADERHVAPVVDPEVAQAAALLGISVDASEDEIRAALRSLLSSSRLHPDQGGDGEEAKRLIAAKNLLVERARAVRS
jgi:hypothetical protein